MLEYNELLQDDSIVVNTIKLSNNTKKDKYNIVLLYNLFLILKRQRKISLLSYRVINNILIESIRTYINKKSFYFNVSKVKKFFSNEKEYNLLSELLKNKKQFKNIRPIHNKLYNQCIRQFSKTIALTINNYNGSVKIDNKKEFFNNFIKQYFIY